MADEILARGPRAQTAAGSPWREQLRRRCGEFHTAITAYPDGADLVMSMWAFGMGGQAPFVELHDALTEAGLSTQLAPTAARTLLHFVYGHAYDEQSHAQATRSGITADERPFSDFDTGLDIVLAGIEELIPS